MRAERGVDVFEIRANLRAQKVAADWGALAAFLEHETIVHRGDTDITRANVDDEAGCFPGRKARADGGFSEVEGGDAEVFERDLGGFFAVLGSVPGGLGDEKGVLGEVGGEARGESVAPERGDNVPVSDEAIRHGVADVHAGAQGVDIIVAEEELGFAVGGGIDGAVVGWDHGFGCIFACEAGASPAGTGVQDEGRDFI